MPRRSKYTPLDDYPDSEKTLKKNYPQQLLTDIVSNYDVKILAAQIREEIYHSLICRRLFPDEPK